MNARGRRELGRLRTIFSILRHNRINSCQIVRAEYSVVLIKVSTVKDLLGECYVTSQISTIFLRVEASGNGGQWVNGHDDGHSATGDAIAMPKWHGTKWSMLLPPNTIYNHLP